MTCARVRAFVWLICSSTRQPEPCVRVASARPPCHVGRHWVVRESRGYGPICVVCVRSIEDGKIFNFGVNSHSFHIGRGLRPRRVPDAHSAAPR